MLIDEYTSLLDRRAARDLSQTLGVYLAGKSVKGVVLATCHKDVIRMLGSTKVLDWVLWTDTGRFICVCACVRVCVCVCVYVVFCSYARMDVVRDVYIRTHTWTSTD